MVSSAWIRLRRVGGRRRGAGLDLYDVRLVFPKRAVVVLQARLRSGALLLHEVLLVLVDDRRCNGCVALPAVQQEHPMDVCENPRRHRWRGSRRSKA